MSSALQDSSYVSFTLACVHLSHMLVVRTLIIQLPQAHGTYSFNAGTEQWIFFREMSKDTLGRFPAFSERKYERKYFGFYWDRIRDMIDQCAICRARTSRLYTVRNVLKFHSQTFKLYNLNLIS